MGCVAANALYRTCSNTTAAAYAVEKKTLYIAILGRYLRVQVKERKISFFGCLRRIYNIRRKRVPLLLYSYTHRALHIIRCEQIEGRGRAVCHMPVGLVLS